MDYIQLQLRHDTAAAWAAVNPVLAKGEPGVEIDTLKVKFGDGETPWNALAYLNGTGVAGVSWGQIMGDITANKALVALLSRYVQLAEDGKVPAANLPNSADRRQLDLAVPGEFAAAVTPYALYAVAKDYSTWQLEKCVLESLLVRCCAADTGAVPASVYLVINGAQVGPPVSVVSSSWTTLPMADLNKTISTGDQIEIGVSHTGTNKNSENLRAIIVARVSS